MFFSPGVSILCQIPYQLYHLLKIFTSLFKKLENKLNLQMEIQTVSSYCLPNKIVNNKFQSYILLVILLMYCIIILKKAIS